MSSTKFKGNPVHVDGTFPKVGDRAPAFKLIAGDQLECGRPVANLGKGSVHMNRVALELGAGHVVTPSGLQWVVRGQITPRSGQSSRPGFARR
jgi:hypothetical protein